MKKGITYKATDFQYPTKEERKEFNKEYPKLTAFGFSHKSELESFFKNNLEIDEVSRESNLFWWDNCLQNRLGKLHEAYIYTMTHYSRGIGNKNSKFLEEDYLNKFLFDFYAETFYFLYFSVRDVVAQILNWYYSVGQSENETSFNKCFIKEIEDDEIKNTLNIFFTGTKTPLILEINLYMDFLQINQTIGR